jgi:hypothetical protein
MARPSSDFLSDSHDASRLKRDLYIREVRASRSKSYPHIITQQGEFNLCVLNAAGFDYQLSTLAGSAKEPNQREREYCAPKLIY